MKTEDLIQENDRLVKLDESLAKENARLKEAETRGAINDSTILDASALISEFVEDGKSPKRGEYRDVLRALRLARANQDKEAVK